MLKDAYSVAHMQLKRMYVFDADLFDNYNKGIQTMYMGFSQTVLSADHQPFSPLKEEVKDDVFRMLSELYRREFVEHIHIEYQNIKNNK